MYPHPDLLRACQSAGVPVTFGSDAHAPNEVAADLAAASALMRSVGYDAYVRYERRERKESPLLVT
jgi:histidinol-phosphatase (PHP family)